MRLRGKEGRLLRAASSTCPRPSSSCSTDSRSSHTRRTTCHNARRANATLPSCTSSPRTMAHREGRRHTTPHVSSGRCDQLHRQLLACRCSHISQAYLKFSDIKFQLAASSNHASPSGALPFLLPTQPDTTKHVQPVPSGRLQRWTMNNSEAAIEESGDLRYEAYLSLLDHRIRRAWVGCRSSMKNLRANKLPALQHLPLQQLHIHRRATLHPADIKQSLCPPYNSARAPSRG